MTIPARDLEVLDLLADAAEPTWILLKDIAATEDDRPALEAILCELERKGLVTRSRELSGNPDRPPELDDWWALTAAGSGSLLQTAPIAPSRIGRWSS